MVDPNNFQSVCLCFFSPENVETIRERNTQLRGFMKENGEKVPEIGELPFEKKVGKHTLQRSIFEIHTKETVKTILTCLYFKAKL